MHHIRFSTLGLPEHRAHIHLTRLRENSRTKVHDHDFHEAFLVMEGEGLHHLDDRVEPIQRGDLVRVFPENRHYYSTGAGQNLAFLNMAVAASWVSALVAVTGDPHLERAAATTRTLSVEATRELARGLASAGVEGDPLRPIHAWRQIHQLLCKASVAGPDAFPAPPAWLETWRAELSRHPEWLAEPLAFWQKRAGRSAEHLARSCRRHWGRTPGELLNLARLERARTLLRTTDEKVITVALEAGFQNMSQFYRLFLRETGYTPREWRVTGKNAVP